MGEAILYNVKHLPTNFVYNWNTAFNDSEFVDLLINNPPPNSEEQNEDDESSQN